MNFGLHAITKHKFITIYEPLLIKILCRISTKCNHARLTNSYNKILSIQSKLKLKPVKQISEAIMVIADTEILLISPLQLKARTNGWNV